MIKEIHEANQAFQSAQGTLKPLDKILGNALSSVSVDHKTGHAVRALNVADEMGIDISKCIS